MAPVIPSALAADADILVKAAAPAEAPWWTHGFVEIGGRGFLNNPQRDGHIFQGGNSLAKFYEYRDLRPGPTGDFFFAAGSKDGLYEIDAWGKNVGYRDQRYDAYVSKAGEQYFNFMWDQTPHVYSTSASTLFNTNGNALTLINPNIGALISAAPGGAGFPNITAAGNAAKTNAISTIINQNVVPTDVGIRRDTASVDYRYTPTDNWDFKANYSNMRRTGSQVDSVLFTGTNTGSRVDVAKPVADTTQNFGVNGEYAGTSAWGQKFNAIVGYNGSVYQDDFNNYTVQNPFCVGLTCAGNSGGTPLTPNPTGPLAMMSTPPNNQMNGVTGTLGADLPLNSRYMGTVAYTGMRQNDAFLPFSINGVNLSAPGGGTVAANLASTIPLLIRTQGGLGATSLNGSINTLLVNNVLTSQITPDLKTKLSYRYYDYDNQTPELNIFDWAIADACSTMLSVAAGGCNHPTYQANTLSLGYIKQNAGAEATWRPVNSVNIGAAYGYEHYDWTRADASSTAENSGKVYADWKPTSWTTFRASGLFAERRAGNYDYLGNVGIFQWPNRPAATQPGMPNGTTNYSPYYRQFYLDDRDRAQAKFSVDVKVLNNLTVTPTFNLKNDTYIFSQNQEGLTSDRSYAAGIETAYAATPDVTLLFSYMNENRSQNVLSASNTYLCPFTASAAACLTSYASTGLFASNVRDTVNTVIFGVNYAVIPQKFDVHLGYTLSMGNSSQPLFFANGTGPTSGGYPSIVGGANIPGQFPDVKTTFQRVDATAKYVVDKDFVTSLGLKGEVALKLRYAWERNSVTSWNNDTMQPYMYTALMNQPQTAYYQALAGNNPNYNVHLLGGTVSFAW